MSPSHPEGQPDVDSTPEGKGHDEKTFDRNPPEERQSLFKYDLCSNEGSAPTI
jgi:hypothetical protein